MGDFNAETSERAMSNFMDIYNLKNLVKHPTCFKNPDRPCIDLIVKNKRKCFLPTNLLETGIPDFHKMVVTILKQYFKKQDQEPLNTEATKTFAMMVLGHHCYISWIKG